jgi:predicted DNA-binding transcriptional regulator YafY
MPRNDQAIRQLVILNKLEASRHGLTLDQLAEAIDPASTRHPRTLRRDLAAIESAGWPVLTERFDGQVPWKLLEGSRNIPALRLSPSELMALTVSRRLIAPLEGTELHASLQSPRHQRFSRSEDLQRFRHSEALTYPDDRGWSPLPVSETTIIIAPAAWLWQSAGR